MNRYLWSCNLQHISVIMEPRHEKTCLCSMRTTKGADQPAHLRILISAIVFRCLDSIIPLVSVFEISSPCLAIVTAQTGFCITWSQTPKTGFLVMRLII